MSIADARVIAALAEPEVLLVFSAVVTATSTARAAGQLQAPCIRNVLYHALWPGEEDVAATGRDREGAETQRIPEAAGVGTQRAGRWRFRYDRAADVLPQLP
ncbi:hypothetical protein GKC29_14815 [Micromonospora sp. WMMC415]|uniref:hypothetical protein n=1 Tax=Micromonospora sp. WMMC415 TaxID=2675222 RepID=UPI0012B4D54D|nr:hypothetical protein [Micromonospora sp. WMMC415]QGN47990.1 hypothetical protein GKC29_14815 [Micromonospora sp. WMMC415]